MRRFAPLIGVAILLLAVLAIGSVWDSLRLSLTEAGPVILLIGAAWYSATILLRAWRWRALLTPVKKPGMGETLSAMANGWLAAFAGAPPAGIIVRSVQLSRTAKAPSSASFVTAAGERLFDVALWTLLAIVLIARDPSLLDPLRQLGRTSSWTRGPGLLLIATSILVVAAVAAVLIRRRADMRADLARSLLPLLTLRSLPVTLTATASLVLLDVVVIVSTARILGITVDPLWPLWAVIVIARGFSFIGRVIPWSVLGLNLQHGLFVAALGVFGADLGRTGFMILALQAATAVAGVGWGLAAGATLLRGSTGSEPPGVAAIGMENRRQAKADEEQPTADLGGP